MSTVPETAPPEVETHRKPPFLRRVRIRNFKSIKFCDVTLEPLTVLVGRNGSGKSNFVEALAFLRDSISLNFSEAIARHGGLEGIAPGGVTDAKCAFEIDVHVPFYKDGEGTLPGGSTYRWTLEMPLRSTRPSEWSESLISSGEVVGDSIEYEMKPGHFLIRAKPNKHWWHYAEAPRGMQRPVLTYQSNSYPAWDLVLKLSDVGVYAPLPSEMRCLQKRDSYAMMSRDGSNAVFALERMIAGSHNDYQRLVRYLTVVVPGVVGVRPVSYGSYYGLRFTIETGKTGVHEFDASSMSDGTLRMFASLLAAIQKTPEGVSPTLVAIEEPETALHPAAMHALVDALDEATGRTQILLTTHSTELLDNPTIRPENVRVVEMVNGETVITPVDEATVEIVKRQLDTLGGLERQNQLGLNDDDRDRQQKLAAGSESK